MTEPDFQPQAQGPQADKGLWGHAPGWRKLAITASFLTLAALALPTLLPQPEAVTGLSQNAALEHVSLATPAAPAPAPSLAPEPAVPLPTDPAPATVAPRPHALVSHVPVQAEAAPQTQAAPQAPVCALHQARGPAPMGQGTIIGLQDASLAHDDIPRREARQGGAIDPHYLDDQRAMVRQDDGRVQAFDVPKGMPVHVGDRVSLQNSYQNVELPCSYVPILITADSGPAAQAAPPAALPPSQ